MAQENNTPAPVIKAASACVWRGEEVLLVQRAKSWGFGTWSLPGGSIEADEEALAAAHRELMEETGVSADLNQLVGVYRLKGNGARYEITCFMGHYRSGEARAAGDAMAIAWQHYLRLAERKLAFNTSEAVAKARQLLDQ